MAQRIAIASSNGALVDTHFGHATSFFVYEIDERLARFVERRDVSASCAGGKHETSSFDATLSALSDCSAVVVSMIGYGAAEYLREKGMRVFESPYFASSDVAEKIAADGLLDREAGGRVRA
jgi:Uncharacterized conserved protein